MSRSKEQVVRPIVAVAKAQRRALIIVENLPCPFDRRVWQEARTLRSAGYGVAIICPKGKGYERSYEESDGISIDRHPQPFEARRPLGYVAGWAWGLGPQTVMAVPVVDEQVLGLLH